MDLLEGCSPCVLSRVQADACGFHSSGMWWSLPPRSRHIASFLLRSTASARAGPPRPTPWAFALVRGAYGAGTECECCAAARDCTASSPSSARPVWAGCCAPPSPPLFAAPALPAGSGDLGGPYRWMTRQGAAHAGGLRFTDHHSWAGDVFPSNSTPLCSEGFGIS